MQIGFCIPPLTNVARDGLSDGEKSPLRYEHAYEICKIAEDLGFDFGTVGHHRFSANVVDSPAPFVTLAALAARTKYLKLSPQIVILPTHHPLEMAEQAALFDEISNGRLIFGAAIGYRPYEFDILGLSYKDRTSLFEEAVAVIRGAWRDQPLDWHGKHFNFSGADVWPKPIQKPGPPIWIGGQMDRAISRAARIGDGWITTALETVGALIAPVEMFRAEAREAGMPGQLCVTRYVTIASTRQEVDEVLLPALMGRIQAYAEAGAKWRGSEAILDQIGTGRPLQVDALAPDQLIAGDPHQCLRAIEDIRTRLNPDALTLDFGRAAYGEPYEKVKASLQLFGREVLPRLN